MINIFDLELLGLGRCSRVLIIFLGFFLVYGLNVLRFFLLISYKMTLLFI